MTLWDELGVCEVSLNEIIGSPGMKWTGPITLNGEDAGSIILSCETVQESSEVLKLNAMIKNVNNTKTSCLGMCSDIVRWKLEVRRVQPGTDRFITVKGLSIYTDETEAMTRT